MTDSTREVWWKNIHSAATIVRKSASCVMSATPKKTKDRHSKKQQLQILWSKCHFWMRKSAIWKIFVVKQRRKCRTDFSVTARLGFSTNERRKPFRAGLYILWSQNKKCSWTAQFYWSSFTCMEHKSRWRFKLQGFGRSMQKTAFHHHHAWKKQHQKTAYWNRRLLRFVAFVHLPFSVQSPDLLVASLVFMKIYEGHFMLFCKE